MLSTVHGKTSPSCRCCRCTTTARPIRSATACTRVASSTPARRCLTETYHQRRRSAASSRGSSTPVTAAEQRPQPLHQVYFPLNSGANPITIIQGGGAQSCQVFCAYHNTYVRNGSNVYYGVMPNLDDTGPCGGGVCGAGSALDNLYATTTRKMATEAITDPAVGLAQSFGPPLSWYDPDLQDNEIGDICAYIDDAGRLSRADGAAQSARPGLRRAPAGSGHARQPDVGQPPQPGGIRRSLSCRRRARARSRQSPSTPPAAAAPWR